MGWGHRVLVSFLLVGGLCIMGADAKCNNSGLPVGLDAGQDAGTDGGEDAGTDAGEDAGTDAGDAGETCIPAGDCENGGVCEETDGGASCDCEETGYVGDTCDEDIDECDGGVGPCANGSTCANNPGSYECDCDAADGGWMGMDCDEDINECTPDGGLGPCSAEGTDECDNFGGGFNCDCNEGYDGEFCDECAEGYVMGADGGGCILDCPGDPNSPQAVSLKVVIGILGASEFEFPASGLKVTPAGGSTVLGADVAVGMGTKPLGPDTSIEGAVDGGADEAMTFEIFQTSGTTLGDAEGATSVTLEYGLGIGSSTTLDISAEDVEGSSLGTASPTIGPGSGTLDISALISGEIHSLTITAPGEAVIPQALNYTHICLGYED